MTDAALKIADEIEIRLIPQAELAAHRDALVQLFSPVDKHDIRGMTAAEFVQWAIDGRIELFMADGGKLAWGLTMLTDGHSPIAEIIGVVGAGFRKHLGAIWPQMEAVCRARGAARVVLNGRPGWRRIMDKHGFAVRELAMVKELD
jgi:hypothetical protein